MRWTIFIFLIFGFSLFAATVNTMGIFQTQASHANLNVSDAQITEITTEATEIRDEGVFSGIWGGLKFMGKAVKIIAGSIIGVFTLDDTMRDYQIPEPIITLVYGIVVLAIIYGLVYFFLNR